MTSLQIDISGRGGLGGDWYGYNDQTIPTPNMSYSAKDGEMVGGFFNPFTRPGYLFPSVSTLVDLTSSVSTTVTTTLGASVSWQTLVIALAPSGSSVPAVVAGYSASVEETSDTSMTKSFEVVSSPNIFTYLIVAVTSKTGSNPTGVTYNGDALHIVDYTTDNGYISFWYRSMPDTGTNDIVVTWGSAVAEKAIHAMVVTGVGNIGGSAKNWSSAGTTASATITPSTTNHLIILMTASANATHTQGTGQSERTDIASTTTPYRYSTSTIAANTRVLTTSSVYDVKNDDYYLADEQHIFKGDGLDDTSLTTVLELGPTDTPVIMDMEIYQVNGVEKLFYVYETGGNLQVGIGALPYSDATDNPTWLTGTASGAFTTATTSDYNFMRVANSGYAYIFADNAVHKIDGTTDGGANGTVTEDVIVFPGHYRFYDAVDYRDKMFMVVHKTKKDITTINSTFINNSTDCGVYIWDRSSTQLSMTDYIGLEGVRAIKKIYVSPKGDIRIITISSDNMVQIRSFNGNSFDIIKELGLGAAPQYPDSVVVAGLKTMWLGTDGTLYAHGQVKSGEPEVLARIGQVRTPSGDPSATTSVGAVLYGGAASYSVSSGYRQTRQALSLSYFDGSDYVISKFYPFDLGTINSVNQNALIGNIYTPVKYLPKLSTVNKLVVYMNPVDAGAVTEATIKIYFNQSTTAFKSHAITRDDMSRGYVDIPINKQYINAIQLEIEYATNITLYTYTFAPSIAIVDYSPTNTNK